MHIEMDKVLYIARKMSQKTMTATGIVSPHECFLFHANLAATSGGATANVLYKGTSTRGIQLMDLNTLTSTSFAYPFDPPVYCPNGLYLVVGSYLASLMFHFFVVGQ